jgi:hypothetical protein
MKVADPVTPRLLRREQAARYLGISIQQLDLLRVTGEIDDVPMPGRNGDVRCPLYDVQDLDRAITKRKSR